MKEKEKERHTPGSRERQKERKKERKMAGKIDTEFSFNHKVFGVIR